MLQRQVSAAEVFRVLTTAHRCYGQPNERWRLDGEELTVVVELSDDAIVVTLFRGDEDGDEDEADQAVLEVRECDIDRGDVPRRAEDRRPGLRDGVAGAQVHLVRREDGFWA